MTISGRSIAWGAALLLLVGFALPARHAAGAASADVLQKIQAARTPADYEALATYFEGQAAAAKSEADTHRKMAETYKAGGTSIGKGPGPLAMPQHCQALAKGFDEEAAHYTAMAQTYRELAKAKK